MKCIVLLNISSFNSPFLIQNVSGAVGQVKRREDGVKIA